MVLDVYLWLFSTNKQFIHYNCLDSIRLYRAVELRKQLLRGVLNALTASANVPNLNVMLACHGSNVVQPVQPGVQQSLLRCRCS